MYIWLKDSLFTILYAVLWAYMEVEIEGEHGWGAKLPTTSFYGTHFTWYHAFMNSVVVLTLTYSTWSNTIFEPLFYITEWFLIEDFTWFIINPSFGWEKYKPEFVWWHADQPWIKGVPWHNYFGLWIMVTSAITSQSKNLSRSFLLFTTLLMVFTFVHLQNLDYFATLF